MLSPLSQLGGAVLSQARRTLSTSVQLSAARKGYRERKKAGMVKKEEVKKEWVPASVRRAELLNKQPRANRRFDRNTVPEPIDDVYKRNWFRWTEYPIEEAVEMHRETHHPTVFNRPNELVFTTIELDMQLDKKNRFADPLQSVVSLPHPFEFASPREVGVFCVSPALRELATELGVTVVGGTELIKQFQSGALMAEDFSYFVAHTELASELLPLRGLLRRKFPSIKNDSLTADIAPAIARFRLGLEYASEKDERQPDFAQIVVPIGRLQQPSSHIGANLAALLADVQSWKPRNHSRQLVSRVSTWCQPAPERLDIDHGRLLQAAA